ncbi:MAG: UDP-N-acetylglucosamine 1-carboxyvinyltransferase [Candidatus Bruticola sp.]
MCGRLVIHGGVPLTGSLEASGAKNACLPIMAASILAKGVVKLDRVPDISDVRVMADILRQIGVKVDFNPEVGRMVLDSSGEITTRAPEELVGSMNASFDIMGPLLARCKEGEVSMPGGCRLGPRPVNFHIEAFKQLGAEVELKGGFVKAKASKLKGTKIIFPSVSVGATKNAMMAATMAEGTTILEGCAREPEISDLANFLNKMGAKISGIDTQTLKIEGVKELKGTEQGTEHSIIADRIEAGTYLLGAVITGGDVTVTNFKADKIEALLAQLVKAGQEVIVGDNYVRVKGRRPILPLEEISTAPYPFFPTDLHPQIVAALTLANGVSSLSENIFDSRFMYVMELVRLGADLLASGKIVRIRGVDHLVGAPVNAPDIRAGGALVLAGLAAEGETIVRGVNFIDRGYQHIEQRLSSLGADIKRVMEPLKESQTPPKERDPKEED